jgi:putative PIN family toxin of toxin-antitoxin system
MHVVVDANVLLSALLQGRGTHPVLVAVLARRVHLVTSRTLLAELSHVLTRPQWRRVVDSEDYRQLRAVIDTAATIIEPAERIDACRDPEDNAVLECAVEGRADAIITGDADLLSLHPFRGVDILRPTEFLRQLS